MTAKIITIAQQKGGAGKTTLAAQLAVGLTAARLRVATVDIDPQGSLTLWQDQRAQTLQDANTIPHRTSTGARLTSDMRDLRDQVDVIIVDSPPHTMRDTVNAIEMADLVLVPVQPSPMDVWACGATLQQARSAGIPALVMLNRINARTALFDQMTDQLVSMGFDIAETTFGNRVAFAASMARGLGVVETDASTSLAATEVFDLVRELKKHVTLKAAKSTRAAA